MDFLPDEIQRYVEDHTQSEPDLLQEINRNTHLQVLMPRMISGNLQGRVLSMISNMISPRRILEIGTYTAYGTLALAEGLSSDGLIYTIDINEELEDRIRTNIAQSPESRKINYIPGNALKIIPELTEKWDLVFIDADKENYTTYYELVLPNVRKGGFIIADNVLWSGKVIDESVDDIDTREIRRFNDIVHNDSRVQNVLFPIRDGLMVLRKI